MPGPTILALEQDTKLPNAADVVVVGGGIVGACTALELAERGLKVVLCEKGQIGAEQSSRNWGWVRLTGRSPVEIPLMIESLRLWSDLDRRTGRSTGYKKCGIVFSELTERKLSTRLDWLKHLRDLPFQSQVLSGSDLSRFFPTTKYKAAGAIFSPFDGRAEPQLAAPAVAQAARDRGASVITQCAVREIETAGGKISGVVTERGRVAAPTVVVAGGVWSNRICRQLGVDFPLLDVQSAAVYTAPLDGPDFTFGSSQFAFRRRADGGYTVGNYNSRADIVPNSFRYLKRFAASALRPDLSLSFGRRFFRELKMNKWNPEEVSPFEQQRVLDPSLWFDQAKALRDIAVDFPFLANAKIVQGWAGYIDVTPDSLPVIGPVGRIPGLFLASGFSGHGFGTAPAAGALAADLVMGRRPLVDPTHFRLGRFFKHSESEFLEPGSASPSLEYIQ
ncbi:NAD(P)/FAD-dependent oxidoreductase [Aminobacter sp. UC22_36]|uniref:NAD(P)/FAD-dependent oxidoreductase n=1 Tax=Aminobacter sp. UC22_36 TaxID=3374549 RepID=UPI00375768E5